jgi:hypothetical protein
MSRSGNARGDARRSLFDPDDDVIIAASLSRAAAASMGQPQESGCAKTCVADEVRIQPMLTFPKVSGSFC